MIRSRGHDITIRVIMKEVKVSEKREALPLLTLIFSAWLWLLTSSFYFAKESI